VPYSGKLSPIRKPRLNLPSEKAYAGEAHSLKL